MSADNPYLHLIRQFVSGAMPAVEFEERFLELFKSDTTRRPEAEFQVLDRLFAAVDAFVSDPELRDEDDVDEEQLRSRAEESLARLEALA